MGGSSQAQNVYAAALVNINAIGGSLQQQSTKIVIGSQIQDATHPRYYAIQAEQRGYIVKAENRGYVI